jgi:polyphosphate kinase 2 (PPK2 family)
VKSGRRSVRCAPVKLDKTGRLLTRYTVTDGRTFRLKHVDPADSGGITSKAYAEELLARGLYNLRTMQEKLYAQGTWSLLLIFQAMDGAGKDSTIKHVMSGVNPQGCTVASFKAPSNDDLAHDFLWRTTVRLPPRGHIGIFNRSY